MIRAYVTKTIRISRELSDAIAQRAADGGHSQSVLIEQALAGAFGVAFQPSSSPARGGWPRRGAEKLRARRGKP